MYVSVKPPKKKQRVVEPASDSDGDQKLVKTKKDAQNGTGKCRLDLHREYYFLKNNSLNS